MSCCVRTKRWKLAQFVVYKKLAQDRCTKNASFLQAPDTPEVQHVQHKMGEEMNARMDSLQEIPFLCSYHHLSCFPRRRAFMMSGLQRGSIMKALKTWDSY